MRRLLARMLLALGLVLAVAAPTWGAGTTVDIKNFAFSPDSISVGVGDTVTWTNRDSVSHTATAQDRSFTTGLIQPGGSATVTFTTAGTIRYYCQPHREMVGAVTVVPAAPATDTDLASAPTDSDDPPIALLLGGAIVGTLLSFRMRARWPGGARSSSRSRSSAGTPRL